MTDKKQAILATLLLAAITLFFWTQSRFPALDEKAQMGQRTSFSSIAFDVLIPAEPDASYLTRVAYSAINWGYTNWKGMTFGLCFAAAFILLLKHLPRFSPSPHHWLNALRGMIIGIPLGVCANCSTPIADGMVKAGSRIETALATLISSPTLNIFVLTMTFTLLPLHLAVIKLLAVILMVLVVVPLCVRWLVEKDQSIYQERGLEKLDSVTAKQGLSQLLQDEACELPSDSWKEAIFRICRDYWAYLKLIVISTLPLMLLAGVLGALAIEAVSLEALRSDFSGIAALGVLLVISIIGTFLPVPIAFDVIAVSTLLATGFPTSLAMALLLSLGTLSIYPAMIIARRISLKLSLSLMVTLVLLSTATGFIAVHYESNLFSKTSAAVDSLSQSIPNSDTQSQHNNVTVKSSGLNAGLLKDLSESECKKLTAEQWKSCSAEAIKHLTQVITKQKPLLPEPIDPNSCNGLTDRTESFNCFSLITRDFAISTGDESRCKSVPVIEQKEECYNILRQQKIHNLYLLESINSESEVNPELEAPAQSSAFLFDAKTVQWSSLKKARNIEISVWNEDLNNSSLTTENQKHFTLTATEESNLSLPFDFSLSDFYEPFKYGRGVASGDINGDLYPDLVFATANGPKVFLNDQGKRFHPLSLDLSSSNPLNSFLVAFVDLNNDGWLDLFFTTYGGLNYWLANQSGQLSNSLESLPNTPTNLTMAAGFADHDNDGDLDAYLGNWTAGAENNFSTTLSSNGWLIKEDNSFRLEPAETFPGETLSVLFSDLNGDHSIDLVETNDNQAPDLYFYNDGKQFKQSYQADSLIPSTSLTTMSIDSADFNNDLHFDLFTADMSFGQGDTESYCEAIASVAQRKLCEQQLLGWEALKNFDTSWCSNQEDRKHAQQCVNGFIITLAKSSRDPALCTKLPTRSVDLIQLCKQLAETPVIPEPTPSHHIPQQQSNKLLLGKGDGSFTDATETMKANNTFWSWNSKAADLDNDEWQDLLVVNGFGFGEQQNEIHSNLFFHNQQGKHFERKQEAFGLTQHLNTPSYTYTDIDLDGDIDIVATAIMSNPLFYRNNSTNNGISFILRDEIGNRFCIGCKLIITYGNGKQQIRELKLSGGFLSFDDSVLYFGLGNHNEVDKIEIIWSDGFQQELKLLLASGKRYKIERHAQKN